jgi:hypothetical protein
MAFLHRLRAATRHALRVTTGSWTTGSWTTGSWTTGSWRGRTELQADSGDMPALLSRLASPHAELVRADTSWQPHTPCLRIEIMASGPFENLRGIRTAVNRLQNGLVAAIREGALELRLTEVRRTCRHVTAWSRSPVDPGASTTEWECLVDAFVEDADQHRMLFAQAFRDSVRQRVNHIVLFGDSFDDGFFVLNAAVRDFRQRGIRVSTFYLGDDFNGHNMYRFLAASTGGLHMPLSSPGSLDSVLPIVAAFACGDSARLMALRSTTPEAKALIAQARRR